jgi:hypothetical protein
VLITVYAASSGHLGVATVVGVIYLASIVVGIWAFIDAAMKPTVSFRAGGSSKALWMVAIAVTVVALGPIGGAVSWYYLGIIRPKVDAAAQRGIAPR